MFVLLQLLQPVLEDLFRLGRVLIGQENECLAHCFKQLSQFSVFNDLFLDLTLFVDGHEDFLRLDHEVYHNDLYIS